MVCPMSDILTITLNPAYDVSTSVGTVAPGPKLRCEPPRYDPGGGGVNVSRAISRLGGMSTAFVALGGQTGAMFHALLDAEDFEVAQFEIDGNTRQSLADHRDFDQADSTAFNCPVRTGGRNRRRRCSNICGHTSPGAASW
jgi:6-phosphofructokinase 2